MMRPVDNADDLRVLLASRYPLVVAETSDEERLLAVVRAAASEIGVPVWTWSSTRGLRRDGEGVQVGTHDVKVAFGFVDGVTIPSVFVFADVHHALGDHTAARRLKELAGEMEEGQTVVLAVPRADLPAELNGIALRWTLRPPTRAELEELVRRTITDLRARRFHVELDDGDVASLAEALRGLSMTAAERLLQQAAVRDGKVDAEDISFVRREKADLLGAGGVLELVEADHGSLQDVGGMDRLKDWLQVRGKAMLPEAAEFGLDPPRGVLVTGVPGCGKSLVAKTLARTWEMPLVLLDPSRLYGPYVGESEGKLAEALRTAEALAPCVLWVDEIEKGFAAGGHGDGGVSRRILGTFLRWMQDRPPGVFLAATCNDVAQLPPELTRKGRFDEIFFVDLPDATERRDILCLHLRKRNRDPVAFELETLVGLSDGFTGAEVEAAIVGALYRVFAAGGELTTEEIAGEMRSTVPLSRARAEHVGALRAWAAERAVRAS
jgi:hypothetical protein